jgi:hypothetical protein
VSAALPRRTSALGWIELAELLRAIEVPLVDALGRLRSVSPEIPPGTAVTLTADDATNVVAACELVQELALELQTMLTAGLAHSGLDLRWRDVELEAAAALAAGVADVRRVEILARCLSVKQGFRALAEMLRCTDQHVLWTNTTLSHVLSGFREADAHFVRRVTEQAGLSPQTRWDTCDRREVSDLAGVLQRHSATARSR